MADHNPDPAGRDRAVTPATGKLLEVALVVLFVGLASTALYGGAVPGYQSAAGTEVAERTLASASQRVQQAVPPNGSRVEASARVDLPTAITGRQYEVHVDGRRLVLDHPDPAVERSVRLALPDAVVSVSGRWSSGSTARVVVRGTDRGLVVELVGGPP